MSRNLALSPFNEKSPLAALSLQAEEFEQLIAVSGQDALWLPSLPLSGQNTHTQLGRSLSGPLGDGRETIWPKASDILPVKLIRISRNVYRAPFPLAGIEDKDGMLITPTTVRAPATSPELTVQARRLLSTTTMQFLTASQNGALELPLSSGLAQNFSIEGIPSLHASKERVYSPEITEGTSYTVKYQHYPAIKLSIMSQNLHRHAPWVVEMRGDASLSFPDWLPVANLDQILLLSASITLRHKLTVPDEGLVQLHEPYIERVIETDCSDEPPVIVNNNQLYWESGFVPSPGDQIVVSYRAYPLYSIIEQLPNVRSQENQRHPKRAALRLVTST